MHIGCALLEGRNGHEAGLQLLEQMYREQTGDPMPPILRTDRGRPYFSGDPLYFSISHTKRRVFCALSRRRVGIDAEELDRQIDLRLADRILSSTERLRYASQPDKRLALLRFWVLKEAAAKCSGQGLRGYPDHTDFDPDDSRIMLRDGCLLAVLQEEENG